MKKVIIVAPVHRYDDVRVFQKQAVTLVKEGYEVILLARSSESLIQGGVKVIPLPTPSNRIKRFLNLPLVLKVAWLENGDLYHLHNPDTLPLAIIIKILGKKVIYDSHEDFSKRILMRNWIPRVIKPKVADLTSGLEKLVSKMVDATIVTQSNVKERLESKSVVIGNAPIIQGESINKATSFAKTISRKSNFLQLIYVGTISRVRGLFTMLDAINIVNQQQKCHLWLIGSIEDYDLKDAQEHEAWTFVDYLGLLPQWKAFSYIIKSDVGLCVIPNTGDYGQTDPNKLYEYQVFGIPFIASNFEKWKTKLEKVQAGQFVEPNSPEAIAKAILWFINNPQRGKVMGKQGKKYVETEYNWEKESKKLCDCYRNLLSEP